MCGIRVGARLARGAGSDVRLEVREDEAKVEEEGGRTGRHDSPVQCARAVPVCERWGGVTNEMCEQQPAVHLSGLGPRNR